MCHRMKNTNINYYRGDPESAVDAIKYRAKATLKLTYLEYLRQQFTKEFSKSLYLYRFTNREIYKEPAAGKYVWRYIRKIATSDHLRQAKRAYISKQELIFELYRAVDGETCQAADFTWIEKPGKREKLNKAIVRELIVETAHLNESKRYTESRDCGIEDVGAMQPTKDPDLRRNRKLMESLIHFTAGSLAGISQVYVSQPLDTVKVKLQTFPKLYKNMFKCFISIYQGDGIIRGLYAGTVPAVIASIAENSVMFTCYGGCQKIMTYIMGIETLDNLSVLGNACAGFMAGFFTTITLCPTELVKCKLQAVHELKRHVATDGKAIPISTFKLTRDIFVNEGISGFYRGLSSTFVREMPGLFCFFGGYEAAREYFKQTAQGKTKIGPLETMCAGAFGGVVFWIFIFPADVIKSRIQINNLKGSFISVASDILRTEGVLSFYNGLLPTILKTIPAAATLFLVYEYSKQTLSVYL